MRRQQLKPNLSKKKQQLKPKHDTGRHKPRPVAPNPSEVERYRIRITSPMRVLNLYINKI